MPSRSIDHKISCVQRWHLDEVLEMGIVKAFGAVWCLKDLGSKDFEGQVFQGNYGGNR